jgi:bifunctional non-homologous end joining protein LigD
LTLVEVEGRTLKLSNLDKVLYPAAHVTKAEVLDYYARIAPVLLPHLADRFVTLKRYPDGVASTPFFEKNCPSHRPDWMSTNDMHDASTSGVSSRSLIRFCRIDSLAALTWTSNLAALELHTSMARDADADVPTMVVFDLDPGEGADLLDCAEVGLWIRHVFTELGLDSVVKTSGSKGLQVYLPVNTATTHDEASNFAKAIAQLLEQAHPDRVVSLQRKELRRGKVLVDWSQNSRHKTTVCVYSLRARDRPTVSTPVTWDEVVAAVDAGDASMLVFEARDVLDRVAERGDLFAPALTRVQSLPRLG